MCVYVYICKHVYIYVYIYIYIYIHIYIYMYVYRCMYINKWLNIRWKASDVFDRSVSLSAITCTKRRENLCELMTSDGELKASREG